MRCVGVVSTAPRVRLEIPSLPQGSSNSGRAVGQHARAQERYAQNRFSVTRQVRYSRDETQLALDLVRRLGILRTPTTLVLDAQGREVTDANVREVLPTVEKPSGERPPKG